MFTASFAWVQLTVITPLLLQLLLTISFAQQFASHSRHLEYIMAHFHTGITSVILESTTSSCSYVRSLYKMFFHRNMDTEFNNTGDKDQITQTRMTIFLPSESAVRDLLKNYHHQAALCGRMSEALGPLLALSHLYLVYTIIMAIFTFVFDFKVRLYTFIFTSVTLISFTILN